MKKSELLKFEICLYAEFKENSFPLVNIYFDEELIIKKEIKENYKSFSLIFEKDCLFKNHKIKIDHKENLNNNYIRIENIIINSFPTKKYLNNYGIILQKNKILEVKDKTFLRPNNSYEFKFESPYAYYFLNHI